MFDVNFFRKTLPVKQDIISGASALTPSEIEEHFEAQRNRAPYIFNIETTNACNMSCLMCPRPKLMTRPVQHMKQDLFESLVKQMTPHDSGELELFRDLIAKEYGITADEASENAFYFYTIAQSVVLHGYGEPPLDPKIVSRVQACTDRKIPTYFSCVPANIRMDRFEQLFKAGLGTVKFAMESLDPEEQRRVRGENYDLEKAMQRIGQVIDFKKDHPEVDTRLVVTLVAMSDSDEAVEEHLRFIRFWADYPVLAYVKSQDNRWFYAEEDAKNKSHYLTQYCEFAWTSMSVMAGGEVLPCTQDFNAEMVMGNANEQSLEEIWNSERYRAFRHAHITGEGIEKYKCHGRCDLPKVHDRLGLL